MAVVRLNGTLKQLAGGRSDHAIDAATAGDALRGLEQEQPALCGWILDERGLVRRHVNVFVNGDYATADTPVRADDRIDVLQAISGG